MPSNSVPTDITISVKECNQISKHKDLEKEVEKICYLKIISVPEIVEALRIKKETNTQINMIPGSSSP